MRGRWITYAAAGAAGVLTICSLFAGSRLLRFSETISVKYTGGGLSAEQIDRINEGPEEESGAEAEAPFVTGWDMMKDIKAGNRDMDREIIASLYRVYGDMAEAYPKTLMEGSFIGKEDRKGCVVSRDAAERLFGGCGVSGCEVDIGKSRYTVRGVIESDQAFIMIQTREGQFPYLELKYDGEGYPASNSKAALARWGLAEYSCFAEGNLYAGAARLFMGFPFLVLLILMTFSTADWIRREARRGKQLMYTLMAAAVFFLLFLLLLKYSVAFSEDMIPARASDFSFWPEKLKEIRSDYRGLLNYQMCYREAEIVKNLRFTGMASAASGLLLTVWKLLGRVTAYLPKQPAETSKPVR